MSSPGIGSSGGQRFSPITDLDHAGMLWIASLLAGIYSVLSILVRLYIKRSYFGPDDWTCAAATLSGIESFLAIYVGLLQGLGKSSRLVQASQLQVIGQAVFASRIGLIVTLCFSKCSVVLLIKRLFSEDMERQRMVCDVVTGAVILWGILSLIGISIRCDPGQILLGEHGKCGNQLVRWEMIGIFDGGSELTILFLSCGLIWQLQMRMGLKIRVILAFVFRLPLIATVILHVYYVKLSSDSHVDVPRYITSALVCEQVQIGYSLISATIPNLKSFIMSFDTAMMMDISHKLYSFGPRPFVGETESRNITTSSSSRPPRLSDVESRDEFLRRLRPERLQHVASIEHVADWSIIMDDLYQRGAGRRSHEDKSIRRDFHWMVEEAFV